MEPNPQNWGVGDRWRQRTLSVFVFSCVSLYHVYNGNR